MALSHAAFDAGLAVLCEKPLTVDFEAARRSIERIEREGRRAAVNFSLASSPGLQALQQAFGARGAGHWARCSRWRSNWPSPPGRGPGRRRPAPGCRSAPKAASAREVLSHFIFVLQRVLGPASGAGSSVSLSGRRRGRGDGAAAPRCRPAVCRCWCRPRRCRRCRWPSSTACAGRAAHGAIELRDWFGLRRWRAGEAWRPSAMPRRCAPTARPPSWSSGWR